MMVVIRWSCTLLKIDRQMGWIKDMKEEPALHVEAGFRQCQARLCGARQRHVYGERSMCLSR